MPEASSRHLIALHWGLVARFRNYVESAGGAIELSGGAKRASDGGIIWPLAPQSSLRLDAEGHLFGEVCFAGRAHFSAHGGMLSVYLADPILVLGDSDAILSVAEGPEGRTRLDVARLDASDVQLGNSERMAMPAVLTPRGTLLLDSQYPAGMPLDAARLVMST